MYGYQRNLSFLLNANDEERGHFRSEKIAVDNIASFLPPINVKKGDFRWYNDYDIFAGHADSNWQALTKFMKKDVKYITIIREPTAQFESAFSFFISNGKHAGREDRNAEIQRWLQGWLRDADFDRFAGTSNYISAWLNNGQIVDLGMNPKYLRDRAKVKTMITKLDREFDLIFIAEYFDQSLLLLKQLMCWDWKDILYLTQNVREKRVELDHKTRMSITRWNAADTMLYEYFKGVLFRKIQDYGANFATDLLTLRLKLRNLRMSCIARDETRETEKNTIVHLAKNNTSDYCYLMSYSRNVFKRLWLRQS